MAHSEDDGNDPLDSQEPQAPEGRELDALDGSELSALDGLNAGARNAEDLNALMADPLALTPEPSAGASPSAPPQAETPEQPQARSAPDSQLTVPPELQMQQQPEPQATAQIVDELEGWDLDSLPNDDPPTRSAAPPIPQLSAQGPLAQPAEVADELEGWDLDSLPDEDPTPAAATTPPPRHPGSNPEPHSETRRQTKPTPNAQPLGETADRRRSLEDLRVDAQLRIGTAAIPLKTVLSIKVGEVIPLDRPLNSPVQVMAGGRVVASGELVSVNGFYAVKIKDVSTLERHLPTDPGQQAY